MNYRNIIFDFGNVLAFFNIDQLMMKTMGYVDEELKKIIMADWNRLDEGLVQYEDYMEACLKLSDKKVDLNKFFNRWYLELETNTEICEWIKELKNEGKHLYILSNAPIIFEENASFYEITSYFDGAVYSGSIQLAKPDQRIYEYLLNKYQLKKEECFFLDDKAENIKAGIQCGINGAVYHHNLEAIKRMIK